MLRVQRYAVSPARRCGDKLEGIRRVKRKWAKCLEQQHFPAWLACLVCQLQGSRYKETSQTNIFTLPFPIKTGMSVGLDMHIPLVVVHSAQQRVWPYQIAVWITSHVWGLLMCFHNKTTLFYMFPIFMTVTGNVYFVFKRGKKESFPPIHTCEECKRQLEKFEVK